MNSEVLQARVLEALKAHGQLLAPLVQAAGGLKVLAEVSNAMEKIVELLTPEERHGPGRRGDGMPGWPEATRRFGMAGKQRPVTYEASLQAVMRTPAAPAAPPPRSHRPERPARRRWARPGRRA